MKEMKIIKKKHFYLSLLAVSYSLLAAAQLPMGAWRAHLSYTNAELVAETPDRVFCVSDGNLFSVSKANSEIETYSRVTGLNDNGISSIAYNESSRMLLLSYSNGNIDLVDPEGSVWNIPDIMEKDLAANKAACDIFFKNEYAYISNGIGVVVINTNKREVTDTYIVGHNSTMIPILSTSIFGDSIYALAADGVYTALASNPLLVDFNNWKFRSNLPQEGLSDNVKLKSLGNRLYLLKQSGGVFSSADGISWTVFNDTQHFTNLKSSANSLLLCCANGIMRYDAAGTLVESISDITTHDAVFNENNSTYHIAAATKGLLEVKGGALQNNFLPNGPAANNLTNPQFKNGRIVALTAAPEDFDLYQYDLSGVVAFFENEQWKNITEADVSGTALPFRGISNIELDHKDKTHFWVSSWQKGLFEFRDDKFYKHYYNFDVKGWNITDALAMDKSGNLWMATPLEMNSIKVIKTDGSWSSFYYPSIPPSPGNKMLDKMLIAKNGFHWVNNLNSTVGGVFVLNDKGNVSSTIGQQSVYLQRLNDQDGNEVLLRTVTSMAEDKSGDIWAGTRTGIVVFKNTNTVFNSNYTIYRPKIARNDGTDFADYLLDNTRINAIAVDGGNRKWIATYDGVFLLSPDGTKTIHNFTVNNSPLLSNGVLGIAIHGETGEVFFATDKGIISYQSDATEAESSYSGISVYPNPVRENFEGEITINGLMDGTIVRITDAGGNLVYKARANGGSAAWDGRNKWGTQVSSGVYYIMVASDDNENSDDIQTAVAKLLIIK